MLNQFTRRSLIGEFAVTSGFLRVTDPAYGPDVWCAGNLAHVRNGRWLAEAGYYHCPLDQSAIEQHRQYERERIARAITEQERAGEGNFAAIMIMQGLRRELASLEERWRAFDETDRGRVAYLRVYHESRRAVTESEVIDTTGFELAGIDVGVDTARVGFFDLASYLAVYGMVGNPASGKVPELPVFRSTVDRLIEGNTLCGVMDFGVVASAGYGDGMYPCFTRADEGEIVEAYLLFIQPEDEPAT